MLAQLLGSVNKERVLVYLAARGKGYSRQIARFFDAPLYPIQNATDKLEAAGVLVSRAVGNTREYEFNPRYPARLPCTRECSETSSFLARARPRRRGKPLRKLPY